MSVEKRAQAHPDYQKWEQAAQGAESSKPDDAMEHLEDLTDDPLYLSAKAYWFRRTIGKDVSGFGLTGEHLKKVQELAARFRVTRQEAEDRVSRAHADVEAEVAELSRKGAVGADLTWKIERTLTKLETRLERLAA